MVARARFEGVCCSIRVGLLTLILVAGVLVLTLPRLQARSEDIVTVLSVNDYGAKADSGEDATPALQRALSVAAATRGPCLVTFEPGQYDLFRKDASRNLYFVSNTASEIEVPHPVKTIGLWLRGLNRVTIDGQGARLLLHGKMTGFVIDDCTDVEVRNVSFDMADPTVAEFKVVDRQSRSVTCEALPGTRFRVEDLSLVLSGEGWEFKNGLAQVYDPSSDSASRQAEVLAYSQIEVVNGQRLKLTYAEPPLAVQVGCHLQIRDGIRDEVGGLIQQSRNIGFSNVRMNFMHGFGIVSQMTENISFDRLICEPRPESGRTCAAFADFLQFSGCRGTVTVNDSRFNGAQDDSINVHGTHLRIIAQPAPDQILVKFMHPQTYGFNTFFPGDEIECVRMESLVSFGAAKIRAVSVKSPREILLTLDRAAPVGIALNRDVVENVTWTPNVNIRGCYFGRSPTRAILVTTRRKVLIERNTFHRTTMSAILIGDDAKSWFESGPVKDVTIRNNRFIECGEPVILISPESTTSGTDHFVHQNVVVTLNDFLLSTHLALSARATKNLRFTANQVTSRSTGSPVMAVQCPDLIVDLATP